MVLKPVALHIQSCYAERASEPKARGEKSKDDLLITCGTLSTYVNASGSPSPPLSSSLAEHNSHLISMSSRMETDSSKLNEALTILGLVERQWKKQDKGLGLDGDQYFD